MKNLVHNNNYSFGTGELVPKLDHHFHSGRRSFFKSTVSSWPAEAPVTQDWPTVPQSSHLQLFIALGMIQSIQLVS
jgi:hypothetical protein